MSSRWPGLAYGAALIGPGSDVLGFDTEMSMDHSWGPRLQLFLREQEFELSEAIRKSFDEAAPATFKGYPTRFPAQDGMPAAHQIVVTSISHQVRRLIGIDPTRPIADVDWLAIPQQALLELTSGAVFHDELGLQQVRDRFAFYPRSVLLYLLACLWARIGQEEHLVGRAGFVGDEIGA